VGPRASLEAVHGVDSFFEKLAVTQLVKKLPAFIKPEGSLTCLQETATGPHRALLYSSSEYIFQIACQTVLRIPLTSTPFPPPRHPRSYEPLKCNPPVHQ
jgi:hypothetical protein